MIKLLLELCFLDEYLEYISRVPQLDISGNGIGARNVEHKCIVKGDTKFLSIAAASVLAKTERDRIMKSLSIKFPEYKWEKNKGYPTKKHREAILKFGANIHHRKSFQLIPKQLKLF